MKKYMLILLLSVTAILCAAQPEWEKRPLEIINSRDSGLFFSCAK